MKENASNKKLVIIIFALIAVVCCLLLACSGVAYYLSSRTSPTGLLPLSYGIDNPNLRKECPDVWYIDKMPKFYPDDTGEKERAIYEENQQQLQGWKNQTFTVKGKDVSGSQLNWDWIQENCQHTVYFAL